METIRDLAPVLALALLAAQTVLMALGLAQIARISGELGHLTSRQNFLESVVRPLVGRDRGSASSGRPVTP